MPISGEGPTKLQKMRASNILGKQRICENGQEKDIKPCLVGEDVWYSAWGYNESDKIHARLTFNPYFENTMDILDQLLASKSQS